MSRESATSSVALRPSQIVLAFLGTRPYHADALDSVPTAYLPTGGLVDYLDACVDNPSARRGIWRGDDFPFASLVSEVVANP